MANSKTLSGKVSGLKITRDGTTYKGEWKLPGSSYLKKWGTLLTTWRVDAQSGGDPQEAQSFTASGKTSDSMNIASFKATSPNKSYTRDSFYPKTGVKVSAIILSVQGRGKGSSKKKASAAVTASYAFVLPRVPTVEWSYDEDKGTATCTIKTDEGADKQERYDTFYKTAVKLGDGGEKTLAGWKSSKSTEITCTYDIADYSADFALGETLEFRAWAYSRGFKGDNPSSAKPVSATLTVTIPYLSTIKSVTRTKNGTDNLDDDIITVAFDIGKHTDEVQLERRHGEDGSWESVDGAKDNSASGKLYDVWGNAKPADGEKLYYRLVGKLFNFTRTSAPFFAEELYYKSELATASSSIGIVSLVADGSEGLKAVIGYTDGSEADGTEVSWSTDANAWESTESPKTYECTWEDAESQSADWAKTQTLRIRGLDSDSRYYVRARRYKDTDSGYVYGDYAAYPQPVSPATAAGSVSLSADAYVAKGEDITATWIFDGDATQQSWAIHPEGDAATVIASGDDAMGSATIPASVYGDAASVSFYVTATAGDVATDSNVVTVGVAQPPTGALSVPQTCAALPFSIGITSDAPVRAIVSCTAGNASTGASTKAEPDGERDQYDGDSIYAVSVTPDWVSTESGYSATVDIPAGCDLVDGGGYTATLRLSDDSTGLSSDDYSSAFSVAWAHQAPEPPDGVTVTPATVEETDEDGEAHVTRQCAVALAKPDGWADADVYDVYRGHALGYDLIGRSLSGDASFTDRFPAFGDASYRVCARTADGDLMWRDYEYGLPAGILRFDWGGGEYAEMEWGLSFQYSHSKDFESRAHLDGSIGGGWNPAVKSSGSFSGTLIEGRDDREIAALMAMAEYPGAVFCRTPDGRAFCCNVEVSKTDNPWDLTQAVSFSVEGIDLTDEFRLGSGDIEGIEVTEGTA